MSRRSLTLLIASIGTAVAIAVSVLVPVPYVILKPGPTLNTLGQDSSGKQLIAISGHPVYPARGHLNLVTISYAGGPGASLNIFTVLAAWLNPHDAVVPSTELFPPGQTKQQVREQDTAQMTGSQQSAIAAALTTLRISYKVRVVAAQRGYPAYGRLQAGDVITAVDGKRVTSQPGLTALIRARPAGSTLAVTVIRNGRTKQILVPTRRAGRYPVIGVAIQDKFPFPVNISVGDIGGPSAGLMFALGIVDKLSPGDLTGGKFIAGTGEISASGQVGGIGGIQQKMVAARAAGATVFLAPAANCKDAKAARPSGLRLVKVTTLSQAVSALDALTSGRPAPSC
jgi:PDZ domain-containing protein